MMTLLLTAIYIIFIGLGLPDSLFGSAWPAIYPQLDMPVSYANFITVIMALCTASASVISARIINKIGTGIVTFASTLITALAILGFSFGNSIIWFCVLAVPLGLGAGAIDSGLNNFVAVHYSPMQMSFLHCFYGIGVALSPYLMSLALGNDNNWRNGYRIVFVIQLCIALVALLAMPMWKKAKAKEQEAEPDFSLRTLSLKEMIKMPAVRMGWLIFFTTCALEFTCGIWCCTYLVSSEGLSEAFSAKFLTLYYIGMTAGRFVSGILSKKLKPLQIIFSGYTLVGVALVLIALPLPPLVKCISLFFVGFGNGPTFPNMTYLTPVNFGKDISQSIIGTQMASCNLGILVMPALFGLLAQYISTDVFPYYLLILYVIMVICTLIYVKRVKKLHSKNG